MCVCMYTCFSPPVCLSVHVTRYLCGGQRTIYKNWFSLSATWVLETKIWSSRLVASVFGDEPFHWPCIWLFYVAARIGAQLPSLQRKYLGLLSHPDQPSVLCFSSWSHFVAQANLELKILLSQPPECWD